MNHMFCLPQNYIVSNSFERQHTQEYLQQFKRELKWESIPNSTLLDVGCGSGDVTIDYVEPLLPVNYTKIVGIDIAEETIKYARKIYEGKYPRVHFKVMDIEDKNLKIKEQFNHVTSFYCLNFVQDQRQAIKNIYNMVKPGGDIFFVIMAQFHVYWALDIVMGNPKFRSHMLDVATYASPYRYSKTPAEDFTKVLKEAGFTDIKCKANRSYFIYDKNQLDRFLSMVHFLKPGASEDIRQEFNKAYFNTLKELNLVTEEDAIINITIPYQNFVAYAKK